MVHNLGLNCHSGNELPLEAAWVEQGRISVGDAHPHAGQEPALGVDDLPIVRTRGDRGEKAGAREDHDKPVVNLGVGESAPQGVRAPQGSQT